MALLWSDLGYPDNLQVEVTDAFTGHVISSSAVHNITFAVDPDDLVMVLLKPLPDQLCTSQTSWGLTSLSISELATGQDVSVGRLGMRRSSAVMHGSEQARGDCVHLSTLDSWRPWHHGFFGHKG